MAGFIILVIVCLALSPLFLKNKETKRRRKEVKRMHRGGTGLAVETRRPTLTRWLLVGPFALTRPLQKKYDQDIVQK